MPPLPCAWQLSVVTRAAHSQCPARVPRRRSLRQMGVSADGYSVQMVISDSCHPSKNRTCSHAHFTEMRVGGVGWDVNVHVHLQKMLMLRAGWRGVGRGGDIIVRLHVADLSSGCMLQTCWMLRDRVSQRGPFPEQVCDSLRDH